MAGAQGAEARRRAGRGRMNVLAQQSAAARPFFLGASGAGKVASHLAGWQGQLQQALRGACSALPSAPLLALGPSGNPMQRTEGLEACGVPVAAVAAAPWIHPAVTPSETSWLASDPAARPETSTAPPVPVRLHLESAAAGWSIWVGIDGGASQVSARSAALVCELRRALQGSPRPLACVVCNGNAVYQGAPASPDGIFHPTTKDNA